MMSLFEKRSVSYEIWCFLKVLEPLMSGFNMISIDV
ncbi:hypothetical protein C8K58_1157 [Pseudomonas sp. GV047]|nr:hypothetical protein C8K58_1157 [Pseudomonas sp. GV047]